MNSRAVTTTMLALLWMAFAIPASAQVYGCQIDEVPVLDFGRPGANPTAQVDVVSNVRVSCLGGSGEQVKVCIGINASNPGNTLLPYRQLGTGGQRVDYQIYRDAARTQVWGPRTNTGAAAPLEAIITLDQPILFPFLSTGTTGNLPVYGRIVPGQAGLAAGTYDSTMGNSEVVATTNLDAPCGSVSSPRERFTATAVAKVPGSCTIVANDMSFGNRIDLLIDVDASAALALTCTAGTSYTVRLSGGSTTGNVADRRMGLNGTAPGVIAYQLYRDDTRSQVWGDGSAGTATVIGTGTGTGTPATLTVYGRVPAQSTPPAGDYEDTVTATVEY